MKALRQAILLAAAVWLAGCKSFDPQPLDSVPFLDRVQVQERGGIRVSAAVPTRDEAEQIFGVDLARKGVQPVWLEIENGCEEPFVFIESLLDPNSFTAGEVALVAAGSSSRREALVRAHCLDLALERLTVPAGETRTGFVYANLDEGTKYVEVVLVGTDRVEGFAFAIPIPGLKLDSEGKDVSTLRGADEIPDFEDEAEFLAALATQPQYTTKKNGSGHGDPVNFVLVGDLNDLYLAFMRRGWRQTERFTLGSAWRTARSALFGTEYRYSPISSLYVFGRPQDTGMQKARSTIHQRHHLRVWLAPLTFRGQVVFMGAMSRDIGVFLTTKAWNLTTHAIDPEIDESRDYLVQDLMLSGKVWRVGYVPGIEPRTADDPHHNTLGSPYWTDGDRAVFFVDDQERSLPEVEYFGRIDREPASQ